MLKRERQKEPLSDLTARQVRAMLCYDPETGIFTWRAPTSPRTKPGTRAGCLDGLGYGQISINYRRYKMSRLAWLYMTGKWPKAVVDHRDRNRSNDAWSNLREATRCENAYNQIISGKTKAESGHKGVSWHRPKNRWRARISFEKRVIYLGSFESLDDAVAAYAVAAVKYHGEFARVA